MSRQKRIDEYYCVTGKSTRNVNKGVDAVKVEPSRGEKPYRRNIKKAVLPNFVQSSVEILPSTPVKKSTFVPKTPSPMLKKLALQSCSNAMNSMETRNEFHSPSGLAMSSIRKEMMSSRNSQILHSTGKAEIESYFECSITESTILESHSSPAKIKNESSEKLGEVKKRKLEYSPSRTSQESSTQMTNGENGNANTSTSCSSERSPFKTPSKGENSLRRSSETSLVGTPNGRRANVEFSPSRSSEGSPSKRKHGSSKRSIFGPEIVDNELIYMALRNMNLAKEGKIEKSEFDLQKIYKTNSFKFELPDLDELKSYKLAKIVTPYENSTQHFFMMFINVLSNPINCGYFIEEELDLIFSILTLPYRCQMLLSRMIRRKKGWHRIIRISYPQISEDLSPLFQELIDRKLCVSDLQNEDTLALMNLLQLDEVKSLCNKLKLKPQGKKEDTIRNLLTVSRKTKSLFGRSPLEALRKLTIENLGLCVRISRQLWNIFDRVSTLFIPTQDPKENISDLFLMFANIDKGEILFPPFERSYQPIFRNRQHLLGYVEAKNALSEIYAAIENKDWERVRKLGRLAYDRLKKLPDDQSASDGIPTHIKKFMEEHVWVKILSKSIDAFKKSKDYTEAVRYLDTLINRKSHVRTSRGSWYTELALIEMHHLKNIHRSAELTMKALSDEHLNEVDKFNLIERAQQIVTRQKGGVDTSLKNVIRSAIAEMKNTLLTINFQVNNIEGAMGRRSFAKSTKSTWSVTIEEEGTGYTNVEQFALRHYYENGYPRGKHCEGSLPLTLACVLFWDELYTTNVPGSFLSTYQTAPLDLYTSEFYEKRKESIDGILDKARSMDDHTLSEIMKEKFLVVRHYQSIMVGNLFENVKDFQELILCLGNKAVAGICEKIVKNYNLWKAGFPDLVVWNPLVKDCKIVEVKGPGDTLSAKQKLWLRYLHELGLKTEVCHVKDSR